MSVTDQMRKESAVPTGRLEPFVFYFGEDDTFALPGDHLVTSTNPSGVILVMGEDGTWEER